MALTALQEEILRLLARNRIENAESYVAGGLALNYKLSTPRLSRDIDIFHDSKAAMVRSGAQYKNIVYFNADEDPGLEIGSRYLMYGDFIGSYVVQTDDGAEQFPGFDLLFVIK